MQDITKNPQLTDKILISSQFVQKVLEQGHTGQFLKKEEFWQDCNHPFQSVLEVHLYSSFVKVKLYECLNLTLPELREERKLDLNYKVWSTVGVPVLWRLWQSCLLI